MSDNELKTYQNVMEPLVAEAVDRELRKLPSKMAAYIDRIQVITYALNRLPAMYASSEEGVRMQRQRAIREMGDRIRQAARQGIAAVQKDPLKSSTPLVEKQNSKEYDCARAALTQLRKLLNRPDLDWENLVESVSQSNSPTTLRPSLRRTAVRAKFAAAVSESSSVWDDNYRR